MTAVPSRRAFMTGAAALGAAIVTPETVFAARAMLRATEGGPNGSFDWSLATADIEDDMIPPRAMRLVQGRAPEGLSGALYRNGPAKFRRPGGSSAHWFDGDGLMRRFRIADGRAELMARFADTEKRRQETAADAMLMPGFGTPPDPRARLESPDDANAANTSALIVGDAVWALWEAGSPIAMDSETLATRGPVTLRPDLRAMPFLAHPRVEPDGRIWNLGLSGGRAIVWRLAADGTLEDAQVIPLPRASYIHDFTATERHLVIVLQPWVQGDPGRVIADSFTWLADEGTQVLVVDKADLSVTRLYETPPFGFFHLGDAWAESDGTIRFDVCLHTDMVFAALGAQTLLNGVQTGVEPARLGLVVLGADGRGRIERTGVVAEFPRSDARRAGRARRLSVHAALETPGRPFASGVGVFDWDAGRSSLFDFGAGHVAEEMVFVPKPGADAETDAWLVGPSINLAERATELHVFEAGDVEAGPVATWRADMALPAGFHGTWKAA